MNERKKERKQALKKGWRLLVPEHEVLVMQSNETYIRKLVNIKQDDMKKVFHFNAKEKKNNDINDKTYLNLNYAIININYIYQMMI